MKKISKTRNKVSVFQKFVNNSGFKSVDRKYISFVQPIRYSSFGCIYDVANYILVFIRQTKD